MLHSSVPKTAANHCAFMLQLYRAHTILHEKCSFSCEQIVGISFLHTLNMRETTTAQHAARLWNEASPWFIFWIGEQMVSLVVTTGLQEALIPLATTQKLCTGSRALSPRWPLNVPDSCWSTALVRTPPPPVRPAAVLATCNSMLYLLEHA